MDGGGRDYARGQPPCGLWDGHLPPSDYNPTERQMENGGWRVYAITAMVKMADR